MSCSRIVLFALLGIVVHASTARGQMIVAHRGASYDAPENTLAAFNLAWQQKSDGIEGDFFFTADQQIVCIHDRDTERTAGKKLVVEESTLSQLRELEYGAWKDDKWKGEPIPTFDQVYRSVPDGKLFVIELKSKKAIVPLLAAELNRLDAKPIRLLIISFDAPTVIACRKLIPDVPVQWLTRFQQGESGSETRPTALQIADTVRDTGAFGVGMKGNREVIDRNFIDDLKKGGCPAFHVWTIDSIDDAKYFQQLGAVGVTTNRPALIGPALRGDSASRE